MVLPNVITTKSICSLSPQPLPPLSLSPAIRFKLLNARIDHVNQKLLVT